MEFNKEETRALLRELLSSQSLAVLATRDHEGHPYCNLVAFASNENMKQILFATPRESQKYKNLSLDPRVALLIDNRHNDESDFHGASAVTAVGTTREIGSMDSMDWISLYLGKHPCLKEFVSSPTCALFSLTVEFFRLVTRFQSVIDFPM